MVKNLKPRKCRECKASYEPNTEWQKYCSDLCKGRAANKRNAKLLRQAQKIVAQAVGQ